MKDLNEDLKGYIATPWDPDQHTLIQPEKYYSILNDLHLKTNQKCSISKENQGVVCQSHGGNLYEHSKWSELQVVQWFNNKNQLTEGLDLKTARVCAFFHDIGKGGDCIKDMYSPKKYDGKGEQMHPNYSGYMILGKKEYRFCDNTEVKINEFIRSKFNVDIRIVALTAFMHWEFGKINIPGVDPGESDPEKLKMLNEKIMIYLQTFKKYCEKSGFNTPTETLLKYCILIACSDIAAGTNIRLKDDKNLKDVPRQNYISKDPWTAFKMDQRYLFYRKLVLEAFNGKSSFGKTQSDYLYLLRLKCF